MVFSRSYLFKIDKALFTSREKPANPLNLFPLYYILYTFVPNPKRTNMEKTFIFSNYFHLKLKHCYEQTVKAGCTLALFLGTVLFLGSGNLKAQTQLVVPNTNEGSAFIGPYGNAARQLQLLIDDSLLTTLVGQKLNSISFRLPASTSDSWPPNDLTMAAFNIFMSGSVEPADRQLDFVANVVGTQTQVRSGNLVIPAGALTVGSNPNDFSFKINFSTPWQYSGGNLLIEIRHSGTGISSRSVQAASSSAPGYGTLFSALWQSTGNVTQGNFSQIEINAEDDLGISSSKISTAAQLYPNPVKDNLHIKTNKTLSSYTIFDMNGKRILSEKLSGKTVNVAQLRSGQYILQWINIDGNSETAPFIKK